MAGLVEPAMEARPVAPSGIGPAFKSPPARGALGRLDEDTYCAALQQPLVLSHRGQHAKMTTNTNSLPGLNEAGATNVAWDSLTV